MRSIAKRCVVVAVLSLAATQPSYQLLRITPEGLHLLADSEGCRLKPYQCSAGTWTDGIGNTVGVVSERVITEREAAKGLINNVLRVERRLAPCLHATPPTHVYDALVSLGFNVGTAKVCESSMVNFINQQRWREACLQLPRWVYVKGVFSQGLASRRAREMSWCLRGIKSESSHA